MTKTQFVCKMAAASRNQVAVKAWPAPKVSEVLTPSTNYQQFGRRSDLWAAVQDEVSRQNTIARGRELRHWREYGTYGDRVTVLALAIRQSAERKAKAAELAGERRKREHLACYHAAAKDRIASAVDAASCEAAIDGEMQALKNALVYNTCGDYEGWLHGVLERLEYLRGELRAERISLDGLHEIQSLKAHIDPDDVELLEAAGVPEKRLDFYDL
jgi:hypothetical protein